MMQSLTPLEIQKQQFSRVFKGYNADEVRAYLSLVAEEIENLVRDVDRLTRENAMQREDLDDHSQRERSEGSLEALPQFIPSAARDQRRRSDDRFVCRCASNDPSLRSG